MKTYKLNICERRTYNHTAVVQIPDDADIDCICDDLEKALNNGMCDLGLACSFHGITLVQIVEDEGPDCEYEIEDYDEVTEDAEDAEEAETDDRAGS